MWRGNIKSAKDEGVKTEMSEDGVFKKRITDEIARSDMDVMNVLRIIDEAAKEFPCKLDYLKTRGPVITYEVHEAGIKKLSETIEWFVKWFPTKP